MTSDKMPEITEINSDVVVPSEGPGPVSNSNITDDGVPDEHAELSSKSAEEQKKSKDEEEEKITNLIGSLMGQMKIDPETAAAVAQATSGGASLGNLGNMMNEPRRRVCADSRQNRYTKTHAFWDTQPVPKMYEDLSIEEQKEYLQRSESGEEGEENGGNKESSESKAKESEGVTTSASTTNADHGGEKGSSESNNDSEKSVTDPSKSKTLSSIIQALNFKSGPIDAKKTPADVPQKPYTLPPTFDWAIVNVMDDNEIQEVYELLSGNYVEDDDSMFRFDYSVDFLRWALSPPGFLSEWHLGVRVKASGKLVGFISGIPATMRVHKKDKLKTAEINFLCVHKKLRSKRLAPVLIKEITRRVNLKDVWQAVYTAGVVLPKPIAECRYWHRSLNPKKLIEVGFSHLQPRMTLARTVKLYKLPEKHQLSGFRVMEPRDIAPVTKLLAEYLKKFNLHPELNQAEVKHWIFPRKGVVYSLVRESPDDKTKITDFCSFYRLPSSILGNEKYNLLDAAYSYWNVCTSCTWTQLMEEALIHARDQGFDVFNSLDIMENSEFLKNLKFGVGDGYLQYYLYNWRAPKLEAKEVGLVLL